MAGDLLTALTTLWTLHHEPTVRLYLPTQALPRLRIIDLGRCLRHDDSP
jgi:hypothetical protein